MPAARLPENEDFRLRELERLSILDTGHEVFFEQLIDQVVAGSGAPMAAISLVDRDRQWFKAHRGLDVSETPREQAFCAHTILRPEALLVSDSLQDDRFLDNPLVCGAPHIRAYAGAPIVLKSGVAVGSICCLDAAPRQWTDSVVAGLGRFASMISEYLEARVAVAHAAEEIALRRELSETRARYQTVVSSMVEGVTVLDRDGRIVEANDAAMAILNLTRDELSGMLSSDPLWRPVHEDGRPMDAMDMPVMRALTTGESITDGVLGVDIKGGDKRWLSVNAVPLFEDESATPYAVVGTFSDITRRWQRETSLAQARDAAEAASRAKSAFLDTMAHEVRTPLNGMLGLVQHIQRIDLPSHVTANLELIYRSGLHLKSIVDDALDLSRAEAGELTIHTRSFDLDQCIQDAASLACAQAEARGLGATLQIRAEISDSCRRVVSADPVRLSQVLHNLLSNAVKFTDQGRVVLKADLSREAEGKGMLHLRVEDTGAGVPEEFQPHLFDRYARAQSGAALKAPGAGLGLHLSRRIMQLMGGDIAYSPNSPKGSVFTVTLPLKLDAIRLRPSGKSGPEAVETLPGVGLRVLLADDHSINRQVITALLSPFQPQIVLADGGEEARRLALRERFDVVLLDLKMPVVSGLEVVRALRAHETAQALPRTPALCVTAIDKSSAIVGLLDAGFDGVVEKPILAASLFSAIHEVVSNPGDDTWRAEERLLDAS